MSRRGGQPRCRHCGHQVRYVSLNTGKVMPVDLAPDEDGNVAAHLRGGRLHGYVLRKDETPPTGWQRWMPHIATCGNRPGAKPTPRPITLFDQLESETR